MTQIFLPCGEFVSEQDRPLLFELLFVDYDSMSPREKMRVDSAMEFGELYVAQYTKLASGIQVFSTDLGSSEESHKAEIRVPADVPKEKAIYWLADLVRKIIDMGDF
jgi:hypothetical protein